MNRKNPTTNVGAVNGLLIIPRGLRIKHVAQYIGATNRQAQTARAVTTIEAEAWLQELKHADESGEFFAGLTMFCVRGAK